MLGCVNIDLHINLQDVWSYFVDFNYRSSQRRCSIKKGALKNYAKFLRLQFYLKRDPTGTVFPYEFCGTFKNSCFTEHLRTTVSAISMHNTFCTATSFLIVLKICVCMYSYVFFQLKIN